MSDNSEFYKVILLIILSILIFLGLKAYLPTRLFSEKSLDGNSTLIDSVLLEALNNEQFAQLPISNDTISVEGKKDSIAEPVIPYDSYQGYDLEPDSLLNPSVSEEGYQFLQKFYAKLQKLEEDSVGKVRVAYFGDSMNDGDLIVQDVRTLLQDHFGGYGVGYVAITSLSAASRGSVHHKFSGNWQSQSFVSVRNPSTPFGIDGQVFLPKDHTTSWVSYSAGYMRNSTSLYSPTLFYGKSDSDKGVIRLKVDKEEQEEEKLVPDKMLNIKKLNGGASKSITINFDSIQDIPIYGVDFSSTKGVHIDNFSLRGNSGLALTGFNTELMNAFDRVLNYDLIILHYGTNVLSYGSLDYSFYERGMSAVISKLHRCFPHADVLVVSTADKASKIETDMMTDPAVPALVRAQRNFSRNTQSGFINLYSLMGGENSMIKWVDDELANKDYTHFNAKGSKEIGRLLYRELMDGYEKYKKSRKEEEKVALQQIEVESDTIDLAEF